jgi:hypothetical protein
MKLGVKKLKMLLLHSFQLKLALPWKNAKHTKKRMTQQLKQENLSTPWLYHAVPPSLLQVLLLLLLPQLCENS